MGLVVQGCFGGLPWSALQFRGFFFETAGLTKEEVTTIMTTIGFVGIFGGGFSGWLSDRLTMIWPMHGRIFNAPEERALVIAWQASLEGSIAAFGPVIFTTLNEAFGYRPECNDICTKPDDCGDADDNRDAAGSALVFTSSVPWIICGALYTSLHYFYPRDMERIFAKRRRENEAAGNTELVGS